MIKLKPGQKVLAEDGNLFKTEVGDFLVETNSIVSSPYKDANPFSSKNCKGTFAMALEKDLDSLASLNKVSYKVLDGASNSFKIVINNKEVFNSEISNKITSPIKHTGGASVDNILEIIDTNTSLKVPSYKRSDYAKSYNAYAKKA